MNYEESNRLIAEFMGIFPFSKAGQYEALSIIGALDMTMHPCIYFSSPLEVLFIDDFKFHKSWDWLMPVVESIENVPLKIDYIYRNVSIKSGEVSIVVSDTNPPVDYPFIYLDWNGDGKLNNVYKGVVEFIKWYNKNN